jgi:hypothetical protein
MEEIKLGSLVTDLQSGYEGTATARIELFSGNIQYTITPKAAKGSEKFPEQVNFDAVTLKVKGKGISDLTQEPQPVGIAIGDEVQCILTGFKGVASMKSTFMNGCVYFDVLKPEGALKKDGNAESMFISSTRLKLVKAKKVTPIKASIKAPGGPNTRAMRAN